MTESNKLAALLIDPDWDRLHSRLDRFNPFRILRSADNEIRHSNVLAWLLEPEGNHAMGDAFLRKFLLALVRNPEGSTNLQGWPSVLQILDLPLGDVVVYRERDHIDLQVVIQTGDRSGYVLLIENKWHSGEHGGQLERYLSRTRDRYPGFQILPVFLTLHGQEPSDSTYVSMTHEAFSSMARDILQLRGERIPSNVREFLGQYIEIVEEKLQMDQETERLARKLFSQHENAIRLIYDVGNRRTLADAWEIFFEKISGKDLGIEPLWGTQTSWIWFNLPFQRSQKVSSKDWGKGMATGWWVCIYGTEQLKMVLEVGPWEDPAARYAFVKHLVDGGFKARLQEGGTYTRLVTATEGGIKDWDKQESIAEKMIRLWNGFQKPWADYQRLSEEFFHKHPETLFKV